MTPVPVRDAATVILLRDGAAGLEVWLLTRVTQMVFAGGMSVFPGGRVDADDAALPFAGDDVFADLARRLECTPDLARALLGAAVRETFEETGVLLTDPPADLDGARAAVEAGEVGFGELLRDHGLAVDTRALRPWSRWITPEGEVRRYDARFFVGALPEGAEAHHETTEASEADWLPVATAIEQAERGERGLLPPTMATLVSLRPFGTAGDVLRAADDRVITPVQPRLHIGDGGEPYVSLPDGTVVPIPRSMLPPRSGPHAGG
ncbi:MAG TPA: NUDIX hydrolase [Jatrophihabitans sp.]|nr:NUDIX hydrolase [Jatrophihabitans sp.]